jgi:hypothetical protein
MLDIGDLVNGALGHLTPAQWDVWRGWITTLGGLVALLIALSTYRRNVRTKNEEQARKVYGEIVQVGDGKAGERVVRDIPNIEVHRDSGIWTKNKLGDFVLDLAVPWRHYEHAITNGSEEIIGPVHFTQQFHYPDGSHRILRQTFMVLKPDKRITINSIVPGSPLELPRALFLVTFRDSSGSWWSREGTDPIRRARRVDTPLSEQRFSGLARRFKQDEWARLRQQK